MNISNFSGLNNYLYSLFIPKMLRLWRHVHRQGLLLTKHRNINTIRRVRTDPHPKIHTDVVRQLKSYTSKQKLHWPPHAPLLLPPPLSHLPLRVVAGRVLHTEQDFPSRTKRCSIVLFYFFSCLFLGPTSCIRWKVWDVLADLGRYLYEGDGCSGAGWNLIRPPSKKKLN